MLFALMVMPRSRSRSMESRSCSFISGWVSAPVISSKRSASVDVPWSMCGMMQKFRMNFGSIFLGYQCSQLRAGFESPARFSGGPAAFERATHAAQKPCRINIQFATIAAARQLRTDGGRRREVHGFEGPFRTAAGGGGLYFERVGSGKAGRKAAASRRTPKWGAACCAPTKEEKTVGLHIATAALRIFQTC